MNEPDFLFETARLRIRHWKNTDVEEAFIIYGDPVVQRTYRDDGKVVHDLEEMAKVLAKKISTRANGVEGRGNWAIVHRELNRVIGSISFDEIPSVYGTYSGELEVTWALGREYWGQGYATEAARGAIEFGLSHNPTVRRVVARCRPWHQVSRSVAEGAGMRFVGLSSSFGGATLAIYEFANTAMTLLG